jgi:GNAT superfamily N-acetyltransferase
MALPRLPKPHLHHASALRANPTLAATITSFVNEGYRYMPPDAALRWNYIYGVRLPKPDSLFHVIGSDGLFAVLYHPHDSSTPIACAAAKRWECDLDGYIGPGESGWEIVTVTTHVEWMRKGLPGRCVDALVEELRRQMREKEQCEGEGKENLQIWVQAVEDLSGAFWRKKGYVDVRAYDKPAGHWGSKNGCRLLVLVQEFEVK